MAGKTFKKTETGWYFVLTHGFKENGTPQQYKRRGFRTKQDAQKALSELEHSLMMGTFVKATKLTYKEYLIEQYLEDKLTKVKRRTLETYTWLIEKHVIPHIGHFEISKLTPMAIQQLYNRLTKEKRITGENIQKIHTLINDSLKKAERWSLISKNPAALVDRPLAIKSEITVWDLQQVKLFLKEAEGVSRYCIFFDIALTSGMRKGEILGLRKKDIDWNNNCIRITQTLSNDGKEIMPYTKTKAGSRSIDLPKETMKQLKKHCEMVNTEKESTSNYHDHDLVICNEFGKPANSNNIRRIFRAIAKRAELPKIRIHDMRHTHATLLLLQGVNPKIVSERLGHADVRITLDTYSHLLPSMQKETAENFGKMLFDDEDEDS